MHVLLGQALGKKGDLKAAKEQFGIAAEMSQTPHRMKKRIRVGSLVARARLLYSPSPILSPEARQGNVAEQVKLEVVIGTDGSVQDVRPLSGDPSLTAAAMDAVRTWLYSPTLLNGDPVEVLTEVDVNFK